VGKIAGVIGKEIAEFKKNLYQKSVEFRDKHLHRVDNLIELEAKIKKGVVGLFLVPFCNNLDCEIKIKEKVPAYTIRCISLVKKPEAREKCIFCATPAINCVYLGRSY
jgi:hypothetical protein